MLLLVLSALVTSSGASASRGPIEETLCPAQVVVSERVTVVPKGWTVGRGEPDRKLSGVGFFLGPPDNLAALVNDDELPAKEGSVAVWRFPTAKERYWIACYYRGTTTTLRKPLPSGVGLCRVTYDKKLGNGEPAEMMSMSCER
jgi:hypothetical protein